MIVSYELQICKNCNAFCSACDSKEENPLGRALALSSFFIINSYHLFKKYLSLAQGDSLPYWFQGNVRAIFVSHILLTKLRLSAIIGRFELACQPKTIDTIALQIYSGFEIHHFIHSHSYFSIFIVNKHILVFFPSV